jgi:hypothetical protein
VAIVAEVIEAEVVEEVEVEIAIKTGANIEVEDAAIELEKKEVTIALIISHCH